MTQTQAAIQNASNMVFVAAAGNTGTNNDTTPFYPANYSFANTLAVAATDINGNLASFSDYGATTVQVAAPGVNIVSTLPGGTYGNKSGTSQATPFVTGVAALLISQHPDWTATQVVTQIENTVTKDPFLAGKTVTGGIVNAGAALGGVGTPTNTPVDLSTLYSRSYGFTTDGQAFPQNQGIDVGGGHALSATLLGTSVAWAGLNFTLGPAGGTAGGPPDVVPALGQTVNLPAGSYSSLNFLATTVYGAVTGSPFVVTYTDGTTQTITQSFSAWTAQSSFTNESVALQMGHYNNWNGSPNNTTTYLYGYTLALNSAKVVQSVKLPPAQGNINILAMMLSSPGSSGPPSPTRAPLTASLNRNGIVAYGSAFTGGLDNNGHAFSSALLPSTVAWNGLNFTIPPTAAADVVNATGQTVTLPAGNYAAISLLATAVNGALTNVPITVHYADGNSATFTQSFSDWTASANNSNEAIALHMGYRAITGGQENTPVNLYAYSFALNASENIVSVTLPSANLEILAITLTPFIAPPTQVLLSSYANRVGIVNPAPFTGGIDGLGHAYGGNQLGDNSPPYLAWDGVAFTLIPEPNNTTNDVVSAMNQTITLPPGTYSALSLLATGVNGSQPNQTFRINYSDGSSTFTQSLSDWQNPQHYANETIANSSYRYYNADGSPVNSGSPNNFLYGYSFALNGAKTVKSITLPNNPNVEIVAIQLAPTSLVSPVPAGTPVDLSGVYSRGYGFTTDGQSFPQTQGIDVGGGHALSANLLGTSIPWGGLNFTLGPAGGIGGGPPDVVPALGQTINLPTGKYASLNFLATTVYGAVVGSPFKVTYTDGTQTITQSFSSWTSTTTPYSGESVVKAMDHYNNYDGSRHNMTAPATVNLYGYSLALDPARVVQSVMLPPNQGNINILAMMLK